MADHCCALCFSDITEGDICLKCGANLPALTADADPTTCLSEVRNLIKRLTAGNGVYRDYHEDVSLLTTAFRRLDRMVQAGRIPDQWLLHGRKGG